MKLKISCIFHLCYHRNNTIYLEGRLASVVKAFLEQKGGVFNNGIYILKCDTNDGIQARNMIFLPIKYIAEDCKWKELSDFLSLHQIHLLFEAI